MLFKIGEILEGTVTKVTSFGAFVVIPERENKEGLIHISEIADAYITDISKFVKPGDSVRIKVIDIKPDGKVYFSLKQAKVKPEVSIEEKIADFLKTSEERQLDLKKNLQEKIGGRKKKRL